MPEIKVDNLSVIYLTRKKIETPVFNNFNIEFKKDLINVLIGDSGSGKTTLLKAICSLFEYDGDITIDGINVRDIKNIDKKISYVSQSLFLYSHMIVYDILAYPLKLLKLKSLEIDKKVKEIAEEFKITNLLTRKPSQLSIGQRQLVSIAKSLIKDPEILLLDEPFSNLDVNSFDNVKLVIKEVIKKRKLTVILVTHKMNEIKTFGEYIYYLDNSEIVFSGTLEEFITSNDEIVKEFLIASIDNGNPR